MTGYDTRETAQWLVSDYTERRKNPRAVWGIPWGIRALDAMTGGIQYDPQKEMTFLVSNPNVGKTALAAGICREVGAWLREMQHLVGEEAEPWKGKVVRAVLLEGGRRVFQDRMACMLAGVPRRRLMSGKVTDEEFARYKAAQREIFQLPIEYLDNDEEEVTLGHIESFIDQGDTAWWMLDHFGELPGATDGASEAAELTKRLRRLIRRTAPALVLTHQNRSKTTDSKGKPVDGRPTMDNIAQTSQIAKSGDLILGLYRPDMDKGTGTPTPDGPVRQAEILVVKNRNGDTGVVHMVYNTAYTEFAENDAMNKMWLKRLEE